MTASPWLRHLTSGRGGGTVCVFPPADAGATLFRPWAELAPPDVNVVVVTAPGREHRIAEQPFRRVAPLADAIAGQLRAHVSEPFVLFGHSGGALIGREVAKRVPDLPLRHLVVAGCPPPDTDRPDLSLASDQVLLAAMREWGGSPKEVLDDPAIAAAFLPCLRADLAVVRSCCVTHDADQLLGIPICALAATSDPVTSVAETEAWARWTTAGFSMEVVPGGHFFPVTASRDVVPQVMALLPGQCRRR